MRWKSEGEVQKLTSLWMYSLFAQQSGKGISLLQAFFVLEYFSVGSVLYPYLHFKTVGSYLCTMCSVRRPVSTIFCFSIYKHFYIMYHHENGSLWFRFLLRHSWWKLVLHSAHSLQCPWLVHLWSGVNGCIIVHHVSLIYDWGLL